MSSNNSPWNPCGTCWLAPQKIAPETPVNTRVKPSTPRKRLREQRVYAYQRGLPDMLSTCSRKGYGFSCAGQACVNSPPARGPDSNPSKHQIWPKACKTHSPLHRHPLPTCSSTPLHSHSKSKAAPCAEPRPWADHSGKAMTMPGETWATASCCVKIGFHMCSKQWISLGCSATASTRRHMSKVFAERLLTSQKGVSSSWAFLLAATLQDICIYIYIYIINIWVTVRFCLKIGHHLFVRSKRKAVETIHCAGSL